MRAAASGVLVPEVELQPSGSSTTPATVDDIEPVHESMPPPTANRVIVLALPALGAISAAKPKGRKRPCTDSDVAKKRRCAKEPWAGSLPAKGSSSVSTSRQRAKVCFEGNSSPLLNVF